MILKKQILIGLALCITCNVIGQSDTSKVKEILEQTQKLYDGLKSYSVDSEYTLFRGFKSTAIEEQYKAHTIKGDELYYSRIHNTEFLFSSTYYLKVNHDEKRFEFAKQKSEVPELKGVSVSSYLGLFESHSLKETEKYYICSLRSRAIASLPYGKIDLYINKDSYQLYKQVFYFANKVVFKKSNGEEFRATPRLEIQFEDIEEDIAAYSKKLLLQEYISVTSSQPKGINALASYTYVSKK